MLTLYIVSVALWALFWFVRLVKEYINRESYPFLVSFLALLVSPVWPLIVLWYWISG